MCHPICPGLIAGNNILFRGSSGFVKLHFFVINIIQHNEQLKVKNKDNAEFYISSIPIQCIQTWQ